LSLKGKTLLITGASRGIGLAIALRAARDGANIVVVAKTAEEHRHLPGTIYSAATHIEHAGGRALPIVVDVRNEAGRVAYAISKFGMSQCVLGMAEEFRGSGIAFNALWPRSMVATAAIEFGIADAATLRGCRRPDIMADAAYVILNRCARDCTGNFFIDDSLLYEAGVRDFDQYRVDPAAPLHEDLFVPELPSPPPGVSLRAWQ
jgi:NAD(P)-dependent dehydrogenase (short-subunit alcohol dehydrogenase family)